MKKIITSIALMFGITVAYAGNNDYKDLSKPRDNAPEVTTQPQNTTPAPKADYSNNPVVHWDESEWTLITKDETTKSNAWLQTKELDPYAKQVVIVGMVEFLDGDKYIQGAGSQIRRIFSEAMVDCERRIVYPLRDVYATVDFHVVGIHNHSVPKGAMSLSNFSQAFQNYICQAPK